MVERTDAQRLLARKRLIDAQRKAAAIAKRQAEEAAEAEQKRKANIKAMHRMFGGG